MDSNTERVREAWKAFHDHGDIPPGVLGSQIARSWERCRAAGLSPLSLSARVLYRHEFAFRMERSRELIELSRPYLASLSKVAAAADYAAILADADAVVLDVISQHGTDLPELPLPGAQISERAIGPNGIGTALVEEAYVELVGAEHLDERFHEFTSQGIVLRCPDETVCGALALARSKLERSRRVREILLCASYGIEAELCWRRLQAILDSNGHGNGDGDRAVGIRTSAPPSGDGDLWAGTAAAQIQRYRSEARTWRELASDAFGPPQSVDVQSRLAELAAILCRHASFRRAKIVVAPADPYCMSLDSRAFSRSVFRGLLSALDGIAPDTRAAEVVIGVERTSDGCIVRYFGPNVEECVRLVDAAARYGS